MKSRLAAGRHLACMAGIAMLATVLSLALAVPQASARVPSVTIAFVPAGTELEPLSEVEGLSIGLLSPGLGRVTALQTYLDITQGNRVSEALYPRALPLGLLRTLPEGVAAKTWRVVAGRAEDAPADVVPGLLASTLKQNHIPVQVDPAAGSSTLVAVDRDGLVGTAGAPACSMPRCGGLLVRAARLRELPGLISELQADDLLIAIARPPPVGRLLTMGIAGDGFGQGRITSDSTRTRGLVTATDIAPTIFDRFQIAVPDEVNGQAIRAEGDPNVTELGDFEQRLEQTVPRRGPVVGQNILAWVILTALGGLIGRLMGRGADGLRVGLRLLGPAVAYLPLILLITAALEPSKTAERLIVGLGCPLLAALTVRLLGDWRALGAACLATVFAYALDLVAGTELIPLSLIGPNPAAGSRFFGIGNEIEATLGALLPIGLGALFVSRSETREGGTGVALAFAAAGLIGAAIFAAGRFGADVGAAIVLPTAGTAGAALALSARRIWVWLLLAPVVGVLLLVSIDLVAGGGAHLTRSLLQAGGAHEAGDVLERRIRLAARSFERGANVPYLVILAVLIGLAAWQRERISNWFEGRSLRAGMAGALAATLIGTVSNDSGAILLILGGGIIAATIGYAWAIHDDSPPPHA